jgi:hypothetical protein
MWAAEPHLEARKQMGFVVMIFLLLFGGLVYLTKRKVWASRRAALRPDPIKVIQKGRPCGALFFGETFLLRKD